MNNVELLHIKCCFFQFFNSRVALKNNKKNWPLKKKLKWRPCRRERPSLLDLQAVRFRVNFLLDGGWGSISLSGDWVNALECWRSPSLRLVIPGIADISESRIVFITGTVVKHQPTFTHTKVAHNQYIWLNFRWISSRITQRSYWIPKVKTISWRSSVPLARRLLIHYGHCVIPVAHRKCWNAWDTHVSCWTES